MNPHFDWEALTKSFRTRAFQAGGYSVLAASIVIAIAVLINIMASRLPKPDLSAQELFTLSDQTVQLTEQLEEPVTIYWLVSQSSEDGYLTQLLDRYNGLSQQLTVEKIDPIVYPTFASHYTTESVTMNSLIVVSEKRSCYLPYESLYQYDYTSYAEDGNYRIQFAGENELTRALDYVVSDKLSRVYLLTGHGETAPSTTFSSGMRALNLETAELDLLTVSEVPEDADCILIHAPAQDLADGERELLLRYLERGGRILLITDCETGSDKPNLNAVTGTFGLTAESGILVEGDSSRCLSNYPYYLIPDLGSHAITQPLEENGYRMVVPFAGSLSIADALPDGVTVTPLLATSGDAFAKAEGLLASTVEQEENDRPGPFTFAAVADNSMTGAQLIWVSSNWITDEETNAISSGANEDFFLNALAWMCGQDQSISIHPKQLDSNTLTVPAADASRLTVMMCMVLPGLFLLAGAVVVMKRRRR